MDKMYRNKKGIIYFDEKSIEVLIGYQSSEEGGSFINSYRYSYDEVYGLSYDNIINKAWDEYQKEMREELIEELINWQYWED